MKKQLIALVLVLAFVIGVIPQKVSSAKTITKITDGGYTVEYTSAKIKSNKLTVKGLVTNWARSASTPDYSKKGTFKFKLAKNCEIIDGYKDSEKNISIKKFNKLCKKHDSDHLTIAFTVSNNKIEMIRFW